jgi:signal transduction histidine kinase
MGMSISYQIVTVQHNGCLSFSSVPGAGSRFKIVMPLRQPISEASIGLT